VVVEVQEIQEMHVYQVDKVVQVEVVLQLVKEFNLPNQMIQVLTDLEIMVVDYLVQLLALAVAVAVALMLLEAEEQLQEVLLVQVVQVKLIQSLTIQLQFITLVAVEVVHTQV
jgi:hypothetical protein